jgi:hypothetical protein
LDEVLSGLERWKRSTAWLKDNGQYIPPPSTFLNQERWKDTPPIGALVPLAKGEIRVEKMTPEQAAEAKQHADRFDKFKRLSRLNENIGKSDQEIWDLVA